MSKEQIDIVDGLLIEFDEMGFAPTTAVPDPEAYAIEWRNKLTDVLQGYRKQSEWISVEERLPDLETTRSDGYHRPKSVRVLCACKQRSGKVFVKEGYCEWWGKAAVWRIPGSIDSVTHWMPLPEPPKMKGGDRDA